MTRHRAAGADRLTDPTTTDPTTDPGADQGMDVADTDERRYREPAWAAQADAVGGTVALRDLAIERGHRPAAARFASEARVAIVAAAAAGANLDDLAAYMDYPGGAAELDGEYIDDFIRPGWRDAQRRAIAAARDYVTEDLAAGVQVQVRVNRDGALALRTDGQHRWAVASADLAWPPHAVDDEWFTGDWRDLSTAELTAPPGQDATPAGSTHRSAR